MDKVQLIILAAGKGTRMKSDAPKALTLFRGKSFIRHILDNIAPLHFSIKPIIVVGYKKDEVMGALGSGYVYGEQVEQKGTGHAVQSVVHLIDPKASIVAIIFVDQLMVSSNTIKKIIDTQLEKKPTLTMATIIVPDYGDWRAGMNHFGRIIRDQDGSVNSIVEFKDATDEERSIKEINPSIYAFDKIWLSENIENLKSENNQHEYYLTDLIKFAHDQNKKIEAVQIENLIEGLHPNSLEELEILERIAVQ